MGNYCEIKMTIYLKEDTDKNIIDSLKRYINDNNYTQYPEHKLFNIDRWFLIFAHFGYDGYIVPSITKLKKGYRIKLHASINHEINHVDFLLDWLKPYIYFKNNKILLGTKSREDEYKPSNIFLNR